MSDSHLRPLARLTLGEAGRATAHQPGCWELAFQLHIYTRVKEKVQPGLGEATCINHHPAASASSILDGSGGQAIWSCWQHHAFFAGAQSVTHFRRLFMQLYGGGVVVVTVVVCVVVVVAGQPTFHRWQHEARFTTSHPSLSSSLQSDAESTLHPTW
mmetsp:Transcript_9948/g.21881  ORF Transcript_9948/g.21881 Transcript_9948/m.21881 type:complete len:157 (+) Transcript_9948:216-686(+)